MPHRPAAHVQARGDLAGIWRVGRPGQQRITDLTGQPGAGVASGQQVPALVLRQGGGVRVGLRQGEVQERGLEGHDVLPGIEGRGGAEDLRAWIGAAGRWREGEADPADRDGGGKQIALDGLDGGGIALDDEASQGERDAGSVQDQLHFVMLLAGLDAAEGEGQVHIAQPDVDRAAQRRAAEQGETPDAVGGQPVADAGVQAQPRRAAQRVEQVGDDGQFLPGADLGARVVQLPRPQPGVAQASRGRHAVLGCQPGQQQRARRGARQVPVHHGWALSGRRTCCCQI